MRFTDRQSQILELAAQGHGDKEIASRLGVSVHTVRTHLRRLYSGEGLNNRAEAVAAWMAEHAPAPARAEPPSSPLRRPLRLAPAVAAVLVLATAAGGAFGVHALLASRTQPAACGAGCGSGGRPAGGAPAVTPSPAAATPAARASAPASAPKSAPSPAPAPVAAPGAQPSVPPLPAQLPSPAVQVQPATAMLTLVNQDRAAAGLPPLAWNACLAGVASKQAERMATQGYVSAANGVVEDAACLVALTPPGEDLGYWAGVNDAQLNSMLMADPTQRANLLGAFRHLGAAWAMGTNGVAYLAVELR